MKKIVSLFLVLIILISGSGCRNDSNMENINIYTTAYPIEYVVNRLYGDHSTIRSIYPNGISIENYKVTDVLLSEYSNTDMFIFNGLSEEKDYVKPMQKENKNLKIIDVSADITYKHGIEELWLNPSKLLTIANNIKKGFNEYISAKYLKDEIDDNYKNLKIDLTNLEAKYRKVIKNASNLNIVVSDDLFLFLENYGVNVISLDKNNSDYDKNLSNVKNLINNNSIKYIYLTDNEKNDTIDYLIENTSITKISLNTLSTLTDEQRNNYDYLTLMTENLELLKKQLYNLN